MRQRGAFQRVAPSGRELGIQSSKQHLFKSVSLYYCHFLRSAWRKQNVGPGSFGFDGGFTGTPRVLWALQM